MARTSFLLLSIWVYTSSLAQEAMVAQRLSVLEDIVPLEVSDRVFDKIEQQLNQDNATLMLMKRYFQYDEALKQLFLENDVPQELRFACISLTNCNQSLSHLPQRKGWYSVTYQSAKKEGLFLSNYIDERYDILKSAYVFCKSIRKIYRRYEDWRKALIIYASADVQWQKARILSQDSTDNFTLIQSFLDSSYQGVYPHFVATVYLVDAYAAKIDTPYANILKQDVPIDQYVTFNRIADQLGLSMEMLTTLNPIYKKRVIPQLDRLNYLTIPTDKVALFYKQRDSLYTEVNTDTARIKSPHAAIHHHGGYVSIYYTVRSGDVLIRIADLYDCTVSQIKRWNNLRGDFIRVNQRLVIKKPASKKAYYQRINKMTKTQKNSLIRRD